jgi:hypothetical protein
MGQSRDGEAIRTIGSGRRVLWLLQRLLALGAIGFALLVAWVGVEAVAPFARRTGGAAATRRAQHQRRIADAERRLNLFANGVVGFYGASCWGMACGHMPSHRLPSSEWTPKGNHCNEPGRRFAFRASDWATPPWGPPPKPTVSLEQFCAGDFSENNIGRGSFDLTDERFALLTQPTEFQFRLDENAAETEIVLSARADLDCDGHLTTVTLRVTADDEGYFYYVAPKAEVREE